MYDPLANLENIEIDDMLIYDTSLCELTETLNDIKNKSATGYVEFSAKIIFNLPIEALEKLFALINSSFKAGLFPLLLKTSIVIPLHKGGDLNV